MIALGWILLIACLVYPPLFVVAIILLIIGYCTRAPKVIHIYNNTSSNTEQRESVDYGAWVKNVIYAIIIIAVSYGMIKAGMSDDTSTNSRYTQLNDHANKQEKLNNDIIECTRKGEDCSPQYANKLLEQYQYDKSQGN